VIVILHSSPHHVSAYQLKHIIKLTYKQKITSMNIAPERNGKSSHLQWLTLA